VGIGKKKQYLDSRVSITIGIVISIIVCSVKPTLLKDFENNVEKTIGVAHELIVIDNRNSSKGLCRVYNEGLRQVKYDLVCFCHEDILFNTQDWGTELKNVFDKNAHIGLVGVAGAVYKSAFPNPWISVPFNYYRTNLTQEDVDGSLSHRQNLDEGDYSHVAVLDGCFISGKRSTFQQFPWNENLLSGFHLYDMDICLRVGRQATIAVSNHIGLIHRSGGELDRAWLRESETFHTHYKDQLPLSTLVTPAEAKRLELYGLNSYINRLLKLNEPKTKIAPLAFKLLTNSPFKRTTWSILKRLLF